MRGGEGRRGAITYQSTVDGNALLGPVPGGPRPLQPLGAGQIHKMELGPQCLPVTLALWLGGWRLTLSTAAALQGSVQREESNLEAVTAHPILHSGVTLMFPPPM